MRPEGNIPFLPAISPSQYAEAKRRTREFGLARGAKFLIERAGVKTKVSWDGTRREVSQTKQILQNRRVFVIANYTGDLGQVIASSVLPDRANAYSIWVGQNPFDGELQDHFLQIIDVVSADRREAREAQQQLIDANLISVQRGLDVLKRGGRLTTFPERGDGIFNIGVGLVARQLRETDAFVVMMDIQGNADDISDLAAARQKGNRLERTVRISKAINLNGLNLPTNPPGDAMENAGNISRALGEMYKQWRTPAATG